MMTLSNFIRANMEQLLQTWEHYANSVCEHQMDAQELSNHAEKMLKWVAEDLESPQSKQECTQKSQGRGLKVLGQSAAQTHGMNRLKSGFSLAQTATEFRALRTSVTQLWCQQEPQPQPLEMGDLIRFNEAIDQELMESIASYSSEKDQQGRLFHSMLLSLPYFSYILDHHGALLYANKSVSETDQIPLTRLVEQSLSELGLPTKYDLYASVRRAVDTQRPLCGEMELLSPAAERRCYEYQYVPVLDEQGQIEGLVGTAKDITERRVAEEQIWSHANYDSLTGIPNRRLFWERLAQHIKLYERTGTPFALLFIDLDHFKLVNDRLGHEAGDQLLQQVTERIRTCVRETDTVARLSGDEFTVLLLDLDNNEKIELLVGEVLTELALPFYLGKDVANISGSIGIALFPQDADTPKQLVKRADQAMYLAKQAGRNQFCFFKQPRKQAEQAKQAEQVRRKRSYELSAALPGQQLQLYFQPIVDLANGRTVKAEALLRWLHPRKGLLLPANFLGLAEELGLMNDIGNWVFTEAVATLQQWRHLVGPAFQININLSPTQFLRHHHELHWLAYLKTCGVSGTGITMEFTESVLLDATKNITQTLAGFHRAGMQLALEDFGTGYSSLSSLKKFDIDYLKIAPYFIQNQSLNESRQTIAETIIVMAHKLGPKVIATGIETETQRNWLRQAGCDYAQGNLFAAPLPRQEFEKLLSEEVLLVP